MSELLGKNGTLVSDQGVLLSLFIVVLLQGKVLKERKVDEGRGWIGESYLSVEVTQGLERKENFSETFSARIFCVVMLFLQGNLW